MNNSFVILYEYLDEEVCNKIKELEDNCKRFDGTNFKFELDYKLAGANINNPRVLREINEFTYWNGDKLIGYFGINDFGGRAMEVNGMVHPDYRKLGIGNKLLSLIMDEWSNRKPKDLLLLTDRNSIEGKRLIEKTGATYDHTEFEMVYNFNNMNSSQARLDLRSATNNDSEEIAKQNAIYFNESLEEQERIDIDVERNRGFHIYLAYVEDKIIGKVHLHLSKDEGGIFGLGILPEHRSKGFGRELLQRSVQELIALGASNIFLQVDDENDAALSLYTSSGFEIKYAMEYSRLVKKG